MIHCRFCQNTIDAPFLSLGRTPLSNAYLLSEQLDNKEESFPLDVYVCSKCFLVQLDEFKSADQIFSNTYAYHSSYSDTWLEHCKNYVDLVADRFKLNQDSLVIEIASNDGYLLQYFLKKNIPVLGVEPTENTAKEAIKKGINTEIRFFGQETADHLKTKNFSADLLLGNNVFAHVPDINDFVKGLKSVLREKGVITLEFPHLLNLLSQNQFDTIYHEHFSYYSLYTAKLILEKHGLTIFDVEEIPTHGGSLRIYVKHAECNDYSVQNSVEELIEKEKRSGLTNIKSYGLFKEKVQALKTELTQSLNNLKKQGYRIIGYGAPAKGNTLLNYCQINSDILTYTVDRNPHKQDKFLPGSHIPIKNPDVIKADKPDYVLVLPWNIKEEIMRQLHYIREWGGKFIIPIPKVEVV